MVLFITKMPYKSLAYYFFYFKLKFELNLLLDIPIKIATL
jgi:hypothetical protein